jgi:uncharacterized phage protein (TIGR01671 family)
MRIIKFRAWDKENKRFVVDIDLSYDCIGDTPYLRLEDRRFEIMQFTGLKDKNGKEIFEGDILQSYPVPDVISIVGLGENDENNSFGFNLTALNNKKVYNFDTSVRKMVVIGNIYENKELLDVEE